MILLQLFAFAMVTITLGKIRRTHYYMAVLENKQPPFWVRATGKTAWFIAAVFSLEIFD